MKTFVILSLCLGVGIAVTLVCLGHKKTPLTPVATAAPAEPKPAAAPEPSEPILVATQPAPAVVEPTPDPVSAELQRRAKDNPNDAAIPTTLGEALLNKVRQLHEAGADVNEVGILALQADQSFNAALKLDPSNWEAQFVKYSTVYYWPADAKRDNEAAQKLASLIDRQEALPPQPYFAQTYVALGNQYQKLGQPDFAEATWRMGLSRFPNDTALQQKLSGH
jgi:cytochrome c-type biogenesis protein CcmH/NrfG